MANKWIQKLQKMNGAVTERKDRFANVIRTGSPSVDFIFGRTHGLPRGYTTVLYGPPKGGKSVLGHSMMGWVHRHDPEAIVAKFDTEFRSDGQLDEEAMGLYGIDPERIQVFETNSPADFFDQTEKDIAAMCQAGMPLHAIVVDSISGIQGRREMNSESVEKQTIGDHAQTIQIGLKRILPVIRKYDIALILIAQARAEMDQTEQMRGNKYKMQAGFGLQHMAEYFIVVEPNRTTDGRKDLSGKEFVNEDVTDLANKGEVTAMKIRAKMKDSSMGPKGRTGEFTFHFKRGIVNQYEEVFKLAVNRNLIERPNNLIYAFEGQTWKGREAFANALKESQALCDRLVEKLRERDLAGDYEEQDKADAAADDDSEE